MCKISYNYSYCFVVYDYFQPEFVHCVQPANVRDTVGALRMVRVWTVSRRYYARSASQFVSDRLRNC